LPDEEVEGHVFEDSNRSSSVRNEDTENSIDKQDDTGANVEESEEEPPTDVGALIADLEEKSGPDSVPPKPNEDMF